MPAFVLDPTLDQVSVKLRSQRNRGVFECRKLSSKDPASMEHRQLSGEIEMSLSRVARGD